MISTPAHAVPGAYKSFKGYVISMQTVTEIAAKNWGAFVITAVNRMVKICMEEYLTWDISTFALFILQSTQIGPLFLMRDHRYPIWPQQSGKASSLQVVIHEY